MAVANGSTNHGRKGAGPTKGSWKPGQSGNPSGRPKVPQWRRGGGAAASAKQRAEQYVDKAFKLLAKAMADETSPMSARVSAANSILERAYGKAPQDVNVRGSVETHIIALLKAIDNQEPSKVDGGELEVIEAPASSSDSTTPTKGDSST